MSVYRVTEIIGTSSTSWEDAASEAIKTASATIRDLRVAEVVKQDIALDESGAITYRTKPSSPSSTNPAPDPGARLPPRRRSEGVRIAPCHVRTGGHGSSLRRSSASDRSHRSRGARRRGSLRVR